MNRIVALMLLVCLLGFSAALAGPDSLTAVVRVDTTIDAPVVLAADTLFRLRAGVRGFQADRRAALVSQRIQEIADDPAYSPESLAVIDSDLSTDIIIQDRLLISVFDLDAALEGRTREDRATELRAIIHGTVVRYREERSRGRLIEALLLSAAATLVLVVLLPLIARGFRRLDGLLSVRVKGITLQAHEVIRAEWIRGLVRIVIRVARWVLVVLLLYAYAEFVLTRFVWTRAFAHSLLDLTLAPLRTLGDGVRAYIPNFFFLLVLWVITRYLIKFLRLVFNEIERGRMVLPGFYSDWALPTYRIVRLLVIAFAVVVAFPYIPGSSSPAFQGVSIFLGVLFSLGSTSAVANIVAGVILTYMRSFRVGEVVRIQDTVGMVMGSGLLVTRIRTPKNVEVTIPNSTILGTHVTNYTVGAKEGKLILHTSVTIGYDAPWRQVHALLLMAAERTANLLKDPEPFVLQRSLDDFYVTYELNAFTKTPEGMLRTYSDLHQNIQDAFNEYGVQIMSPNYEADRDKPTVVPKERWYEPPAQKPPRK